MSGTQGKSHPARRLTAALQRVQQEADSSDFSATLLTLLARVSGKDEKNPALLRDVQAFFELPRQLIRELDKYEGEEAESLRSAPRTLSHLFVTANLLTPWHEVAGQIDDSTITSLRLATMILDRQTVEKELDEAELERIARDVRELLDDLRRNRDGSGSATEASIEESLVSILRAIDEYWLRGPVVVEQALDHAVGRVAREATSLDRTGKANTYLSRTKKILASTAMVLALSSDTSSIVSAVDNILGDIYSVTSGQQETAQSPSSAPSFVRPAITDSDSP